MEIGKRIVRYKVYFDRSRMYIGYAQFMVLLLVLFKSYKDTRFGEWFFANVIWVFPLFLVVFFGCSIILGYLDKKYIRPHEQAEIVKTNPVYMDMYRKVKNIEKILKKDE